MASDDIVTNSPPQVTRNVKTAMAPLLYQHDALKDDYEARIIALANQLMDAARTDLEATLASIMLDNSPHPYAVCQSVNVALLTCAMGLRNDWRNEDLQSAVCAALTMNVSWATQQDSMLGLNGPLTALQKSSVESHSRLSHKILTGKKIKNRDWLNAVMQHHERPDGSGYLGMRGDSISRLALTIGLADRYCTVIAQRASRAPMLSEPFLRLTVRNSVIEQQAIDDVAQQIGPFLPGTMVDLANGELAVVLRFSDEKERPLVASLGSRGALSLDEGIIRDSRDDKLKINAVLDFGMSYNRLKLYSLWGYEPPPSHAAAPETVSAA